MPITKLKTSIGLQRTMVEATIRVAVTKVKEVSPVLDHYLQYCIEKSRAFMCVMGKTWKEARLSKSKI